MFGKKNLKLPSNKSFGMFFSFLFLLLFFYFYFIESISYLGYIFFFLGTFTIIITIFKPNALTVANLLWMQLGLLIGRVTSPIIMLSIFLFLFVPLGTIMRAFGRDELQLKRYKSSTNFKNVEKNNDKDQYKRQF